jgi:hypothetical protein
MKNIGKIITLVFLSLLFSAVVFAATEDRRSYNATYGDVTSTNFEIKEGVGDPAVGRSTSSNYIIDHGLVIEFGRMTITIATSVNFGMITPLVPSEVTSTVTVNMTGAFHGYSLRVNRDYSTSTIDLNGTSTPDVVFPDEISWNPTGSGNATSAPGNNLSFRVQQLGTTAYYDTTWWGANDSSGTAKYAGFPTIMQQIMSCSTCNYGSTATVIRYRADAPVSQMTGQYFGPITITALVNP